MNRTPCPDDTELLELATWSATDPRRAHVEHCARCRALMLELETIALDDDVPTLSASEHAALSAAVIRGLDEAHPAARPSAAQESDRRPAFAMPWRLVGGLATAASVVLVSLIALQRGQTPPTLERGTTDPAVVRTESVRVEAGEARFRWDPRAGADRYRLELLGTDFSVVRAETLAANESSWSLRMDDADAALRGQLLHWRVFADSAGTVVAESAPEPFELK